MLNIAVWTDVDLDGAASYLVLRWLILNKCNCKINLNTCGPSKLRNEFLKWLECNKLSEYDKVFVLDLDTTPVADLIDAKNVTVFDHHESHFNQAKQYKHAITHVRSCASTTQLVYETFKGSGSEQLTDAQKRLILHVSDYDSYTLALKDTKKFNCLYWTYNGNRVETFANQFQSGFTEFNQLQENAVALYNKKLKEIIDGLQLFCGKLDEYTVVSTCCDTAHNDVAEYALKMCKADIAMLVNLKQQTVSFRKNSKCNADLSKIAERLCNGGGHISAAGGKVTETFLTFTKTLTHCST